MDQDIPFPRQGHPVGDRSGDKRLPPIRGELYGIFQKPAENIIEAVPVPVEIGKGFDPLGNDPLSPLTEQRGKLLQQAVEDLFKVQSGLADRRDLRLQFGNFQEIGNYFVESRAAVMNDVQEATLVVVRHFAAAGTEEIGAAQLTSVSA